MNSVPSESDVAIKVLLISPEQIQEALDYIDQLLQSEDVN